MPKTKYAKADDGGHIAYQITGDGPLDLLMMPIGFIPVDAVWEEPSLVRFLRRLGSFARVIRFDFLGVGLSDPVSPSAPPTLERWSQDALSVLDAASSERAAVLATSEVGQVAILLAASHPQRVASLVLVNAFPRARRAPDYPWGLPATELGETVESFVDPEGIASDFDYLAVGAPCVAGDSAFRDWWDRAGHRGASPTTARAFLSVTLDSDVRHVLSTISVPTLVMHRADNVLIPIEVGRYLAENIPQATSVELSGQEDLLWVGDADAVLNEIEDFLTGVRHSPQPDRVLATVLFTDIVASTSQASALGDRAWRHVLEGFRAAVREQLRSFGGREINTRGDDFLATFDGPARAIRCSVAIGGAAEALGISVRTGLHTGEVELMGEDIGGIAVHIGARVAALAKAGEVLVSRTVTDLVAGSGIRFDDRGEHELKGIPGAWRLFAVAP